MTMLYRKKTRFPYKWLLAAILFIFAMTFTTAEVFGHTGF